tara:strand:- start:1827 stop:2747 length:921 start_codon:yes stop_codon:yes gene_type:complete
MISLNTQAYDTGLALEELKSFESSNIDLFGEGVIRGFDAIFYWADTDFWFDETPVLTKEQLEENYGQYGLEWKEGMTTWDADFAKQSVLDELRYDTMTNNSDDLKFSYLAGYILPEFINPINWMGFGAGAIGMRMAAAGMLKKGFTALGNPVIDGLLTGFAGELVNYEYRNMRQEDWNVAELAASTLFGGAFGMAAWGYGRAAAAASGPGSPDNLVDSGVAVGQVVNADLVDVEKSLSEVVTPDVDARMADPLIHEKEVNRVNTEAKVNKDKRKEAGDDVEAKEVAVAEANDAFIQCRQDAWEAGG